MGTVTLLARVFPLVCRELPRLKYQVAVVLLSGAEKNHSSGSFWPESATSLPLFHKSERGTIPQLHPLPSNKTTEQSNKRPGNGMALPCMLHGRAPVKNRGWNAGAGPVGELSACSGVAGSDATGEMSPVPWGRGGRRAGPLGASGRTHFGAVGAAGGAGSCSAASSAGKSSSLLPDEGVRMLSAWGAEELGLASHWGGGEVEALPLWDPAKLPAMLSSASTYGNGGRAK